LWWMLVFVLVFFSRLFFIFISYSLGLDYLGVYDIGGLRENASGKTLFVNTYSVSDIHALDSKHISSGGGHGRPS